MAQTLGRGNCGTARFRGREAAGNLLGLPPCSSPSFTTATAAARRWPPASGFRAISTGSGAAPVGMTVN